MRYMVSSIFFKLRSKTLIKLRTYWDRSKLGTDLITPQILRLFWRDLSLMSSIYL